MIQMISAEQIIDWIRKDQVDEIRSAAGRDPAILKLRAKDGSTLIRQAIYRQRADIARALSAMGATPDFFDACALGDQTAAEKFLAHDGKLAGAFSEDGFSALGLAVFFGHSDLAIRLLALGASATEASRNAIRVTPLHSATSTGNVTMAAVLLSHGADPNAKEFLGGTPLHTAAGEGGLEMVKLLMRHGGNCSLRTNAGETPLDLARKHRRDDVAAWLAAQPGCQ